MLRPNRKLPAAGSFRSTIVISSYVIMTKEEDEGENEFLHAHVFSDFSASESRFFVRRSLSSTHSRSRLLLIYSVKTRARSNCLLP